MFGGGILEATPGLKSPPEARRGWAVCRRCVWSLLNCISSLSPPSPRRCFQPVLIHIQMLWELMVLGEPIVVMAPSPTVSSELVLALTR